MLSKLSLSPMQPFKQIKRSAFTMPSKDLKRIHLEDSTDLKNKAYLINPEYLTIAQNIKQSDEPQKFIVPLLLSVSNEGMPQGFPAHVKLFKRNIDFALGLSNSRSFKNIDYLGKFFVSKTQKADADIKHTVINSEKNGFPELKILNLDIPAKTPLGYDERNNPFLLEGTFIKMKKSKTQEPNSISCHATVIKPKYI